MSCSSTVVTMGGGLSVAVTDGTECGVVVQNSEATALAVVNDQSPKAVYAYGSAPGPTGPAGPMGATGPAGPAGGVLSVNAQTGAVTLTAADVGAAPLDGGGRIPESYLPAIAITDVFPVASEAQMLALVADRGDIAVRSDISKTFALMTAPASVLGNWLELRTPTDAVLSVAGKTGAVTLTPADAGAAPATATLADAAADSTLPTTASATLVALLQTVRNCLKWLVARVNELSVVVNGSADTLNLAAAGNAVPISAATTIPTNAAVPYTVGTCILLQCGATARTITGPAVNSLTLEGSGTAVTSFTLKANKSVVIRKTATDAWRVYGDV